jgi:hypothetical protein
MRFGVARSVGVMKIPLKPVNKAQEEFKKLCELGGGPKGGPARGRVQETLKSYGKKLNDLAYKEVKLHLGEFADRNPWHVCYAVGLSWGHLARLDLNFTDAATLALKDLKEADVKAASKFCLERGPAPIDQSLRGGHLLFNTVMLPTAIPDSLAGLKKAQDVWINPLTKDATRPKYVGVWNGTAMFMVALFAQPELAKVLIKNDVQLPTGGPIQAGLSLLHQAHFLKNPPSPKVDDSAFDLGRVAIDNGSFVEILAGLGGWSLLDVHSGVYLLGTRTPLSDEWI